MDELELGHALPQDLTHPCLACFPLLLTDMMRPICIKDEYGNIPATCSIRDAQQCFKPNKNYQLPKCRRKDGSRGSDKSTKNTKKSMKNMKMKKKMTWKDEEEKRGIRG